MELPEELTTLSANKTASLKLSRASPIQVLLTSFICFVVFDFFEKKKAE